MQEDEGIMDKEQRDFNDYIAGKIRDLELNVDAKFLSLEAKLAQNSATTEEVAEIIRTGKGFFNTVTSVGKWIRRVIVWLAPLIGVGYGAVQLYREFFKAKGG